MKNKEFSFKHAVFFIIGFLGIISASFFLASFVWKYSFSLPFPKMAFFQKPIRCFSGTCIFHEPSCGMVAGFFILTLGMGSILSAIYTMALHKRSFFLMFKIQVALLCTSIFCVMMFILPNPIEEFYTQGKRAFWQKNIDQKYISIFPKPFLFAYNVKKNVGQWHNATFLSDLDRSKYIGMTAERYLAYFLYPEIRLRVHDPLKSVDALVIYFKKKPALDLLPQDYHVVYQMDDKSLIAVKEGDF